MKTKKTRKAYIEEQIKLTGFTTEIDTMEQLESRQWNVVAPFNYYDRDEKKWREGDIYAFKRIAINGKNAHCRVCVTLVIECKKSANWSWVFLVRPKEKEDILRKTFDVHYVDDIGVAKCISFLKSASKTHQIDCSQYRHTWLFDDHLETSKSLILPSDLPKVIDFREMGYIKNTYWEYFSTSHIGWNGCEVLHDSKVSEKKLGKTSIFGAVMQASKALSHIASVDASIRYEHLDAYRTRLTSTVKEIDMFAEVLIPLVIFEGNLYKYEDKKGVEDIDTILARCFYRSGQYYYRRLIPVVRIDYIDTFLKQIENDFKQFTQSVKNDIVSLDRHTKSFINVLLRHKSQTTRSYRLY